MRFIGDYDFADTVIEKYGGRRSCLIAMMQDIQAQYNYLPPELLQRLAEGLDISLSKVYSVATFYERFSLEAKGRYIIRVCTGTACHVRRSEPILEALRQHLGLSEKKITTEDGLFTLETVACLGACGLSPVLMINGEVHPKMNPEKAIDLIESIRRQEEKA